MNTIALFRNTRLSRGSRTRKNWQVRCCHQAGIASPPFPQLMSRLGKRAFTEGGAKCTLSKVHEQGRIVEGGLQQLGVVQCLAIWATLFGPLADPRERRPLRYSTRWAGLRLGSAPAFESLPPPSRRSPPSSPNRPALRCLLAM